MDRALPAGVPGIPAGPSRDPAAPLTTINVKLEIPETGTYKITFFVADIDSCIWWDSIALEVDGTTNVILYTNNMGFHDNSYIAGIKSSGENIPCD